MSTVYDDAPGAGGSLKMAFTCQCGRRWDRTPGLWLKCHCGANHRPLPLPPATNEEQN